MTEIFLFSHPPRCLLDLGMSTFVYSSKSGSVSTATDAAGYVCPEGHWSWKGLMKGSSVSQLGHAVCPGCLLVHPVHIACSGMQGAFYTDLSRSGQS